MGSDQELVDLGSWVICDFGFVIWGNTLGVSEALETTRISTVAGMLNYNVLIAKRRFRAPHHTISDAGPVGGGISRDPVRSASRTPGSFFRMNSRRSCKVCSTFCTGLSKTARGAIALTCTTILGYGY